MADHAFDIEASRSRTLRRSLTRLAFVVLSVLLLAAPATAARLVQVRVGKHPTFTRVVFELDAASGYRMERHAEGEDANTILVTLDAGSRARNVTSKSPGVETVTVEAGSDQAIARIVAREGGWPIKEMILANPPRIVLDLMVPGTDLLNPAKAPAPTPARSVTPEPAPESVAVEPIAEPTPEVVADVIEPVVVAPPVAPAAEPVELAETPIEPAPEAIHERPAPEVIPPAVVDVEEVTVAEAVSSPEPLAELAESEAPAESAAAELAGEAAAEESGAEAWTDDAGVPPIVAELPEGVPAPAEPVRVGEIEAETETAAAEPTSAPFELSTRGMIAGGVLAFVLLVFLVARHRRSQPEELDVTAMAEADDTGDEERIPEGGFSMESSSDEELPPETFEPAEASPLSEVESVTTPRSTMPESAPGIFDEELEEKEAMDMDNQDLPITHIDPEAPTQMGIGAAAVGGAEPDIARMFQEFERRIAHVEARLDEAVEARDKLERQVSAQNEELRVQRAAIARTQRALRSLNRTEEEQATEPALREQPKPSASE